MLVINKIKQLLIFIMLSILSSVTFAYQVDVNKIESDISNILNNIQMKYNLSAIELSIVSPNLKSPINIYNGNTCNTCQESINAQSIFQIGSITKTFVDYAMIKLINNKQIKLTDTLGKYFPQYSKWQYITIQQLINHTSGIYSYDQSFLWWWRIYLFPTREWSADELITIAYDHDAYFSPDNGWHYSNTDYILLGLIIEKITKQPLTKYFSKNIYNSNNLSLSNTYYIPDNLPSNIGTKLVHGYLNNKHDVTSTNTSALQASGGMLSNANDIANWYLFYTQQLMQYNYYPSKFIPINNQDFQNKNMQYGFGIFIVPSPYGTMWLTPGLTPGYTSLVVWLPCNNVSFSYVINSNLTTQNIHRKLLVQILPIIVQYFYNINYDKQTGCCSKDKSIEVIFPDFS